MKTAVCRTARNVRPGVPFPNAATRREVFQKFLDLALMTAISLGIAASILFLLALS